MTTGHTVGQPDSSSDGRSGVSPFVLILGGLLSHSQVTPADHRLRDDFAPLRAHLARVVPRCQVISFSYGAADLLKRGRDPREAWVGGDYERGAEPLYAPHDTTDLRLADHVRALDWLIADLRARHPQAPIHLIGFSLGGIVALSWAATAASTALAGIRRLVLISAPVGGISSLALLAPTPGIRHVLGRFRIGFGHGRIFRDLRAGSSAIRQLSDAIDRLEIDAVENNRDYLTNGRRIAGQRLLPRRLRTIPLGRGVVASGFLPAEHCMAVDLGGWEHHLRTTHHRILRGHSPQIEAVRARIAQRIAMGSALAPDPIPQSWARGRARRDCRDGSTGLRTRSLEEVIARPVSPFRQSQQEGVLVHARAWTPTQREVPS